MVGLAVLAALGWLFFFVAVHALRRDRRELVEQRNDMAAKCHTQRDRANKLAGDLLEATNRAGLIQQDRDRLYDYLEMADKGRGRAERKLAAIERFLDKHK